MPQYVAMSPDVQVNGETVHSVVVGMGPFRARALAILKESGIEDPRPGTWHSQQGWLNAFKHIATEIGPKTLYQIGMKIPESAQFPPQIQTVEDALSAIDTAYHMNHRGGEIGHYIFTSIGPRSARLMCTNPYPCDFDRGIIKAMAQRFAEGGVATVSHDDTQPCRARGGESCTYTVAW